ncbi:Etoposide induced 2.4 mRNA [Apophysomyces sp. BC1034]|nr:Etoposide induced 2.4 mRNA [Apophysomyces sp. BC1015]KAG0180093.1 Etoposide induced 2.4 mRNA [Apophysomyces sp. BC1021]KAG0190615.1 Etoposide induced 2.4 mRNA [Apophysomyces sp. BC1034]
MLKNFLVNGILFLGGIVILETFYNTPDHTLFGCSYVSLIGYPAYILLLAINGQFYGPVAEKAFQIQASKKKDEAGNIANAVQSMAAIIYTIIFYINCGIFGALLSTIPQIGFWLSFIANCFFGAYYCFEYKWLYLGWTMEQRMSYVENHWAYFLGFGVPFTVLTFFLSVLRSGAVFALVYPSYVIMATLATPKFSVPQAQTVESGPAARSQWMLPNRIPVFYGVRKLNDLVILVIRLIGGVHADAIVSEKKKAVAKKVE